MCMCGGCAQCMSDQGYEPDEYSFAQEEAEDRHAREMEERSYRILMLLGEEPEE